MRYSTFVLFSAIVAVVCHSEKFNCLIFVTAFFNGIINNEHTT